MSHVTAPLASDDFGMDRLLSIGLTDDEIAICSRLWADGLSLRDAGEMFGLSHEQIRRYRQSAEKKLAAAGLDVPKAVRGRKPKIRKMDPAVMAKRYTESDRYNAR